MGTSWGRTGDKRGSRPPGANQNESQKISRTSCEIRDNAKFADVVNVLRNVQMAGIGFEVPLVFGGGKRTFSPKLGTPRGYMPRCALSVCKLPRPHSDCGGLTSIHSVSTPSTSTQPHISRCLEWLCRHRHTRGLCISSPHGQTYRPAPQCREPKSSPAVRGWVCISTGYD